MGMVIHLSPDTLRKEGLSEAEIAEMIALGQNDLYVGFKGGEQTREEAMDKWREEFVQRHFSWWK